jgi:hypothetical protein
MDGQAMKVRSAHWRSLLACGVLLAVAVAVALAPPRAHAAVVRVSTETEAGDEPGDPSETFTTLEFRAGAHRFRGGMTRSGNRYVVTSGGATIHARRHCRRVTARRAVCRAARVDAINVQLSNHNDRFTLVAPRRSHPLEEVTVFGRGGDDDVTGPRFGFGNTFQGGDGRDRLSGGGGGDNLFGGRGRDRLAGRGGDDTFFDSEGGRASNRDVFDGGRGRDMVWYQERNDGVVVDLRHHRGGRRGERDRIVHVEDVTGTLADDKLIGDSHANSLSGAEGDDTLQGGRGRDLLDGGPEVVTSGGVDHFSGGPGADRLTTEDFTDTDPPPAETVNCGSGRDVILASDITDRMAADCELARADFEFDPSAFALITIHAPVHSGAATFTLACHAEGTARCAGTISVDGSSAPFDTGQGSTPVVVPLSADDQDELGDEGALLAQIEVGDGSGGTVANWTATLR